MSADRELLEAAARAAGYVIVAYTADGGCMVRLKDAKADEAGDFQVFAWHPRDDDGDAFRLLAKLKFNLAQGDFSLCVDDEAEIEKAALVRSEEERTKVMRLTIVRAAAATGAQAEGAQGSER